MSPDIEALAMHFELFFLKPVFYKIFKRIFENLWLSAFQQHTYFYPSVNGSWVISWSKMLIWSSKYLTVTFLSENEQNKFCGFSQNCAI